MRTIQCLRGALFAGFLCCRLAGPANALTTVAVDPAGELYLQESGVTAPLGKLNVPAKIMEANCITKISPVNPQTGDESPKASTVVVRAVIWKSGRVTPMRVVSGKTSLEAEAMDAVRLWRYKPFYRDGEPLDVSTDITVDFDPTKPGGTVTHPSH
jgi:TonB family protein